MAENAKTETKMQGMDRVSQACDNYSFTISTKTEVVYQPAPGKPCSEPTINVNGQSLHVVDKFTYLGSALSSVVHVEDEDEVTARAAKAGILCGNVRERNGIRPDTKLKEYKFVVLSTL